MSFVHVITCTNNINCTGDCEKSPCLLVGDNPCSSIECALIGILFSQIYIKEIATQLLDHDHETGKYMET